MYPLMPDPRISFQSFLYNHPNVEFIWLQFMSYTSNTLVRIVPIAKFKKMLQEDQWLALTRAVLHLLPGDRLAEGASPSGKFHLRPDFSTAYCQYGSSGTRAVVNVYSVDSKGEPLPECARSRLQELHQTLQYENDCSILIGFEVEVTFLKPKYEGNQIADYEPLNTPFQHSFTGMAPEDRPHIELIEAVARALKSVDIELEQFHAEAGPGQWEFVLPPFEPVTSIEILLRARETITLVAQSFGYRATVATQPFPQQPANGAHIHMSLNAMNEATTNANANVNANRHQNQNQNHDSSQTQTQTQTQKAESFFAGILHHFPAILAFALPNDMSYSRIASGTWSGGEYAAWGWENKEVALRRIENNRFEIKLVDGFANPYLVLCALLSAGIIGLRAGLALTGGPCVRAAAQLSADERCMIGLKDALPDHLDASLDALEEDGRIQYLLGQGMVSSYLAVKRGGGRVFEEDWGSGEEASFACEIRLF
ncbi:FluG family protein [Penicillium cosmopolitanum]|uniref:FluG family protein n=1 Tax=Penicillium cosmopolitanum TaxID=1131564 RepID=A0A9X0BEN6_9EURO|nr:FluG family protein [Penicillium cosmopolitanum]KAJ5414273.1 FluG family protein [Penicillium cosmopolitanum]